MALLSTRNLATAAALLLVLGLGPSASAPPRTGAERGVRRALIKLNKLLAERDLAILDEFAKGEDVLLVGSEPGETARGRAELEQHFRKLFGRAEILAYSWREVDVSVRSTVAWIHAEGYAILRGADGEKKVPYRLAGVLELQGGRWKWKLFQGSQPAA